jgi:hypothetical protein
MQLSPGDSDLLVRNQNGEMRILVDPQPLGQVALRFIHPQTGGSLGHAIVLTAGELIDLRDRWWCRGQVYREVFSSD